MALQGDLRDMAAADLIQHACLDGKTARVTMEQGGKRAALFFDQGQIVDAELDGQRGEEVIYAVLGWKHGAFALEPDVPATVRSITRSYTSLLLAGAQRLDEAQPAGSHLQEVTTMAPKKKSEILADTLAELLAGSADMEGAAVVGTDGLILSINVPTGKVEEELVGAVAAAALGLSKRSVEQLKRGTFTQSLLQGDKGNIIISQLDSQNLFVGLTRANVNLGMAFAETRDAANKIREVL